MITYDHITIIYNPNSTGGSKKLAKQFAKQAGRLFPKASIELIGTEFARHAEELSAQLVVKHAKHRLLLVSSSGDGGYHEVINGVMDVVKKDQKIVCAVLPAGNANDHSSAMHETSLVDNLAAAKETNLDLLKISIKQPKGKVIRYAHSYAGLGLTPVVGAELNKHNLNPVKEKFIAAKAFQNFKPFKISHNSDMMLLDSLVFTNINQMAKVLSFGAKNQPSDGKFEITAFYHDSKPKLLLKIAKAAVGTAKPQKRAKRYTFTTMQKVVMQLDGEVISIPKDSLVVVSIMHHALTTLV